MQEEQLRILKMVEANQIDPEEAVMLLAALPAPQTEEPEKSQPSPPQEPAEPPTKRWARFWIFPLLAGGMVLFLGLLAMALVSFSDVARGWMICGWIPLLLGLCVMLLAVWSRNATWLHLRIKEEDGRRIAFSFPIPLTLTAWIMRIAQPFVPQLQDTGVDDLLIALRDSAARGEPMFIDVQDDEKGERVEIFIG